MIRNDNFHEKDKDVKNLWEKLNNEIPENLRYFIISNQAQVFDTWTKNLIEGSFLVKIVIRNLFQEYFYWEKKRNLNPRHLIEPMQWYLLD